MLNNKRASALALIMLALVLSSGAGCTKGPDSSDDPKGRLQEYISKSFAVRTPEDKKELVGYLTGEAKTRLSAWSDEQFREAFIDSKRQFLKLAFREVKQINPSEVSVTYELTYLDQGKGRDAKVTNKKLAQMLKEQGKWVVGSVRNIKELVEYQNEVSLP